MRTYLRQVGRWGILGTLLWAGAAAAADFYLNDASREGDVALPGCPAMPEGSDVPGCGACDLPCRSPAFLADAAGHTLRLGDTVHFNTGRYVAVGTAAPIVTLAPAASGGVAAKELWLTLTGPVDADGLPRRDADGSPLAILDGQNRSAAGVVVKSSGVRLRALRIEAFPDAPPPYCGSAVHVLPDEKVERYAFEHLDLTGVVSKAGSAIEIEQPGTICDDCRIAHNRIFDAIGGGPAILVDSQVGVRILGNVISDWGSGSDAAGILVEGEGAELRHNLVQYGAGLGIVLIGNHAKVWNNTLRQNAQGVGERPVLAAELAIDGGRFAGPVELKHNIFSPGKGRHALAVSSQIQLASSYNGFDDSEGGLTATWWDTGDVFPSLKHWQEASGQDGTSLEGPARFATGRDAHLRSVSGRWEVDRWVSDAETSPFLDGGDPTESVTEAPFLHGGIVNLGAYGNTPQASLSPAHLVRQSGDDQTGEVGAPLASALVVEVRGFNPRDVIHPNYPDVPLRFRVVEGRATPEDTVVVTDIDGRAALTVTPASAGRLVVEVSVEGVPGVLPVQFEAQIRGEDGEVPGPEDPWAPPPRALYSVGCGCNQGGFGGTGLALLFAAGWLWRRMCPTP